MRIIYFDYIKVIMKTFIIVTHVVLITQALRSELLFPFWIDQAVPFFWVISAFLFYRGYKNHNSKTPFDELRIKRLWPRYKRILIPYIPVFALIVGLSFKYGLFFQNSSSLFGVQFDNQRAFIIPLLLLDFICGAFGPGGYYIPMLFQMYVMLPFVCSAFDKRPAITTLIVSAIVLIWECLFLVFPTLSPEMYRLVIFRYGLYFLTGLILARLYLSKTLDFWRYIPIATVLMIVGGGGISLRNKLSWLSAANSGWVGKFLNPIGALGWRLSPFYNELALPFWENR